MPSSHLSISEINAFENRVALLETPDALTAAINEFITHISDLRLGGLHEAAGLRIDLLPAIQSLTEALAKKPTPAVYDEEVHAFKKQSRELIFALLDYEGWRQLGSFREGLARLSPTDKGAVAPLLQGLRHMLAYAHYQSWAHPVPDVMFDELTKLVDAEEVRLAQENYLPLTLPLLQLLRCYLEGVVQKGFESLPELNSATQQLTHDFSQFTQTLRQQAYSLIPSSRFLLTDHARKNTYLGPSEKTKTRWRVSLERFRIFEKGFHHHIATQLAFNQAKYEREGIETLLNVLPSSDFFLEHVLPGAASRSTGSLLEVALKAISGLCKAWYVDVYQARALGSLLLNIKCAELSEALTMLESLLTDLKKHAEKKSVEICYGFLQVLQWIVLQSPHPALCEMACFGNEEAAGLLTFDASFHLDMEKLYYPLRQQSFMHLCEYAIENLEARRLCQQLFKKQKFDTSQEAFLISQQNFKKFLGVGRHIVGKHPYQIPTEVLKVYLSSCLTIFCEQAETGASLYWLKQAAQAYDTQVGCVLDGSLFEKNIFSGITRFIQAEATHALPDLLFLLSLLMLPKKFYEWQEQDFVSCVYPNETQNALDQFLTHCFIHRDTLLKLNEEDQRYPLINALLEKLFSALKQENNFRQALLYYLFNQALYAQRQPILLDESRVIFPNTVMLPATQQSHEAVRLWVHRISGVRAEFSSEQVSVLIDEQGLLRQHADFPRIEQGRLSRVNAIVSPTGGVHLKLSIFSPQELMAKRLRFYLTGNNHRSECLWFEVSKNNKPLATYPVLATESLSGKTLQHYTQYTRSVESQLDSPAKQDNFNQSYGMEVLFSMLTRLGDAKSGNYIVLADGTLISIDHELFCVNPFKTDGKNFKTQDARNAYYLNIKNVLYCMEKMKESVPPRVIEHFLSLNVDTCFRHWLAEMHMLDTQMDAFLKNLTQQTLDVDSYFKRAAAEQNCDTAQSRCYFKPWLASGMVAKLYKDLKTIQRLFRDAQAKGEKITYQKILHEIDPSIAVLYQRVRKENGALSADARFLKLAGDAYHIPKRKPDTTDTLATTPTCFSTIQSLIVMLPPGFRHEDARPPRQFCKELENVVEADTLSEKFRQDLIAGRSAEFEESLNQYRQALMYQKMPVENALKVPFLLQSLLSDVNFCQLSSQVQLRLTQSMSVLLDKLDFSLSVPNLKLVGCEFINDEFLNLLLSRCNEVRHLHLENCPLLTNRSLLRIEQRCAQLSSLTLIQLPRLTEIRHLLSFPSHFTEKTRRLYFPTLTHLTVQACENVQRIDAVIPLLRVVTLAQLPALKMQWIEINGRYKVRIHIGPGVPDVGQGKPSVVQEKPDESFLSIAQEPPAFPAEVLQRLAQNTLEMGLKEYALYFVNDLPSLEPDYYSTRKKYAYSFIFRVTTRELYYVDRDYKIIPVPIDDRDQLTRKLYDIHARQPSEALVLSDQQAYSLITLNGGFRRHKTAFLMMCHVGDTNSGHSALCYRYLTNRFSKNHRPGVYETFGVPKQLELNGRTINVYFSGMNTYKISCASMIYWSASVAIVVCDLTRPSSFEGVKVWVADIKAKAKLHDGRPMPYVVIGNKVDLIQKKIPMTAEEAERFAAERRARKRLAMDAGAVWYMECSAATGYNVELAFSRAILTAIVAQYVDITGWKPSIEETARIFGLSRSARYPSQARAVSPLVAHSVFPAASSRDEEKDPAVLSRLSP